MSKTSFNQCQNHGLGSHRVKTRYKPPGEFFHGALDLAQHVLEDGNVISTQERVINDVSFPDGPSVFLKHDPLKPDVAFLKNTFIERVG